MCIMSGAGISTMTTTTMSDAAAPMPSPQVRRADVAAMRGYLRADGRKGIRNFAVVAYLVECAHHVARRIAAPFEEAGAQLIGFPGCYPSAYAHRVIESLCTHPNVGAVLIVSLGCEEFRRSALRDAVERSGRPVELLVIQEEGGTAATIEAGRAWLAARVAEAASAPTVPLAFSDLVIGTKCGGSDGLSGITANPAVGSAFDRLNDLGATLMFEETSELFGCEDHMAARAATPELGREIVAAVRKADAYHQALGQSSFGGGNIKYGLSTIEEKSLGAYAKSGTRAIRGLIKPGDRPPRSGLYLMDTVSDGPVRHGYPNINDNQTITEMVASGAHMIVFTTGAGSVVGQAVAPVIKVVSNSRVFQRLAGDIDVNAGTIADGAETIAEVAERILEQVITVASGVPSRSEALGHQEFSLNYKSYEPIGPACMPV